MSKKVGLIGYPLSHSYSPMIWQKLFEQEGLTEFSYELFEISDIRQVLRLLDDESVIGFNVTIPYKREILNYLQELTPEAQGVGAVNTVVKATGGKLIGHNTDAVAFECSLLNFLSGKVPADAMILGTGGSAAAVKYVFEKQSIPYISVSRSKKSTNVFTYEEINLSAFEYPKLIVNTTPLGMYPNVHEHPPIDFKKIKPKSYCFDLIYNPEKTLFLQKCENQNAFVHNGLEMLHLQARKAWEFISKHSL
ncbi:shikimate 5-dehydrogenase [Thermaurantimonas aggregans]|uniref:Shikimate 5-dehydrogenase n=1 Tax=Thermaurantimonas aggregans TaxID=2173829 RepID=A0A401XHW7_9FLAO|nr:shikimate dehydrogenase [Thermaurantimonas aggregans]MCX8149170.1 shikimate dehydrogenase [Thermaurantimonas aggregans]GCD76610.1 shikimate 5-dehydrogenase [Thermaurantimonas aggregans]